MQIVLMESGKISLLIIIAIFMVKFWYNNTTGADGVKIAVLRKGRAGSKLI
jgi:hypothetical protein